MIHKIEAQITRLMGERRHKPKIKAEKKPWKESKRARGGLRKISDLHEAPQLSVQISKTVANAIINGAIAIYAIVAV